MAEEMIQIEWDNQTTVVSRGTVEAILAGERAPEALGDAVLRAILADWLVSVDEAKAQ